MQTFDVFSAARTAPTQNQETHLPSQRSGDAAQKFGDVMDRALNGASPEANDDNPEVQNGEHSGRPDTDSTTGTHHAHHTHHTKNPKKAKAARHHSQTQNDAANATAQVLVTACAPQMVDMPVTPENAQSSEGTSHDSSDKGTVIDGKPTAATGKAEATPKLVSAELLGQAQAPPLANAPSSSPAQNSSPARGSNEAKGSSGHVLTIPPKAEASDKAPARSEVKEAQAKDSAESTETSQPATDAGLSADKSQAAESQIAQADSAAGLATPAVDSQKPSPSNAKASTGTSVASTSEVGGTSAAKQYTTMKNTDKTPKVAGPTEQDLPGNTATGSEELPAGQKSALQASLHGGEKTQSTPSVDSAAATRISTSVQPAAPTTTSTAVAPASPADGRLRVLERTHDIVALHAMRLSQTSSDSLHVVVKPGDGLQLSLELRQSSSGIEVHASLHKGDFEHLSQYWPELQQRLETRGVRVGPLTTSENFSQTSNQQFHQSKQQQEQSNQHDPMHAGAFAEFALAGSVKEAPATRAARAGAYRGWETWA